MAEKCAVEPRGKKHLPVSLLTPFLERGTEVASHSRVTLVVRKMGGGGFAV